MTIAGLNVLLEQPNQAQLASTEWVAQKPCVRVAPLPVFSNVQVTTCPFFREIAIFRSQDFPA